MSVHTVAFFGDVVGEPGRRAFEHAVATLRAARTIDAVIVNAENARNGSGLHPDGFKSLRRAGADALTLGDHAFKDLRITEALDDPERPVARPANLSAQAPGKTVVNIRVPVWRTEVGRPAGDRPEGVERWPLTVVTVLGRLFIGLPADNPFDAVDREVALAVERHPETSVIVEMHAEATSEKQAMVWHCLERWPGRVVGVVGTHTHVQTADARVVDGTLAAITDLGMCAGHRGVIGRIAAPVLRAMRNNHPASFEVASEEPRACGVVLSIDFASRRALAVEPFAIDAPP